jgi:hypothetical protein
MIDLPIIDIQSPPNVLLLGNGLLRSAGGPSTEKLLKTLWTNPTVSADDKELKNEPFPIRIIIGTNDSVDSACEQISSYFTDAEKYKEMNSQLVREFLELNWTDILTTNYSYEQEYVIDQGFLSHPQKYAVHTLGQAKKRESKYFLQSYYQMPGGKNIWHIHGEAKNKSSIVIGQYYYAKLLGKYIDYLMDNLSFRSNAVLPFARKSWLDSFIYGNVYIVGLRLSLAESDLWWLLNRKKLQTNQKGTVHLYLNKNDGLTEAERQMLRLFHVIVHQDNSSLSVDDNNYFAEYYKMIYREIKDSLR